MTPINRRALVNYVLITYGITWLCWISAFLLGFDDPSFSSMITVEYLQSDRLLPFLIFRFGVYGPLVASLIVTQYYYKKKGRQRLVQNIFRWRVKLKWYLAALIFPLLILSAVVVIGIVLTIPFAAFFNSQLPFLMFFPFLIYQILTSGLEEPGWRGFALELLEKAYSFEKMNWILGTVWAIWHFPYVIYLYYSDGLLFTLFSLAGFTLSIIGQTFIISWLYLNSRSVLLMILFHAWLNTVTTLFLGDITIEHPVMGTVPALATWGFVLLLTKYFPVGTLKNKSG
ncbi:hypothetical protein SAMN04488102_10452 [Alkalibacterium subtropicum]|uniref:CAAX prenyl protease 2/Lysostaphin resistance protein A-like domain-containing protein n=1 Tax=Alkalibacterium subtropicum TaxID=753702 RepID=A0A1I1HFA4_9LACT|nr:CPBP family intramembrane glutamic endopeptidase [Alkalibacterium subtropicum]SFC22839.1 hypothetical protein SAMN04488102_10452 [Alkalibacterium subtropicum]